MATIQQLNMHIDRSSFSLGSICDIHYDYYLILSPEELAQKSRFIAYCEVWGRDTFGEKLLSEERYDVHEIKAEHSMDVSRSFVFPCPLLNEKLGVDRIFLKLIVKRNDEKTFSMKSDEIHDAF